MKLYVFTHTVKYDDRRIDRITEYRQKRRDHGTVHRDLEERICYYHDKKVMSKADDRRNARSKFKSNGNVNKHQYDRNHGSDYRGITQIRADRGTDIIDLEQIF